MIVPTPEVLVTSLLLTIEPADIGLPVHEHSGPVVGYVFEGEFLHQVSRIDVFLNEHILREEYPYVLHSIENHFDIFPIKINFLQLTKRIVSKRKCIFI